MDDTDKTQGQIPNQQPQQPQAGGGDAQGQTQIQPPQQGVGSLVKEHGPIATGELRPSRPEPEIHHELDRIVVKSAPEFPEVGPSEQKAGIRPSGESVPAEPSSIVHPSIMTEEEAKQTLKNAKPSESRWGLATVIVKFFKSIHHSLIKVQS